MYTTLAAILSIASVALGQVIHNVSVGPGLAYFPSFLEGVSGGDIIRFVFVQGNHTVTQSTFADPCTTVQNGQDSGYLPFVVGTAPPVWSLNVPNNLSGPLWLYCAQQVPGNHCHGGMVFAVNPTADQTFTAFRAAAIASGNSSTSTGSSSGTPTSSASGSTTLSSAPSPSGSTSGTGTNSAASSSTSSGSSVGDTDAASPSQTNGAMSAKVGAGVLLSGAGFLAGLVL